MYLTREYPDEIDTRVPRFVYLPRYVAQALRRVPNPPAFLYNGHLDIETRAPVTFHDIVETLIFWITVSIGFFDDNFAHVNDELFLVLQLLKRARDDDRFDHGGASLRFSILNQLRESLQSAM